MTARPEVEPLIPEESPEQAPSHHSLHQGDSHQGELKRSESVATDAHALAAWSVDDLVAQLQKAVLTKYDDSHTALIAGLAATDPDEIAALAEWLPPVTKAAAVLVLLMTDTPMPRILLIERGAQLTHHAGQIAFPGGRVDATDVSRMDTALREAWEECGVNRDHVEVLGYFTDCVVRTGFRITPVVGVSRRRLKLAVDGREAKRIIELPLSVLIDEAAWRVTMKRLDGRTLPVWELRFEDLKIWGATAGILKILARVLSDSGVDRQFKG